MACEIRGLALQHPQPDGVGAIYGTCLDSGKEAKNVLKKHIMEGSRSEHGKRLSGSFNALYQIYDKNLTNISRVNTAEKLERIRFCAVVYLVLSCSVLVSGSKLCVSGSVLLCMCMVRICRWIRVVFHTVSLALLLIVAQMCAPQAHGGVTIPSPSSA